MRLSRRQATEGLVLGLTASSVLGAVPAEAAQGARNIADDAVMTQTLQEIRNAIRAHVDRTSPVVLEAIRRVQRAFLLANQKYPDYIEVGVNVWEQLYAWKIHTLQVPDISVLPTGRYGMPALQSLFVLRVNADPNYLGPGDDALQ